MDIRYGIFIAAIFSLITLIIIFIIKNMEFIKVNDVHGDFTCSKKNIIRVSAIIINKGC